MSIRQMLTGNEIQRLSQSTERSILNRLLNKPVNQHLLHELQCILDSKPLPRQKTGQVVRGQMSRLTDGSRYPCTVRKMTEEEKVKYGVK